MPNIGIKKIAERNINLLHQHIEKSGIIVSGYLGDETHKTTR